jgi:NAD(P)-dependent dehydrogenase (short-subunit alcohol dehydrogenase family)
MKKKTAIVTGSSSGFGLLCVTELAKAGFEVIATMRDLNKADLLLQQCNKQNVSDSIHLHALDVTSKESIVNFKKWLEQWPSIDVLVNNAGIALGGMIEEIPLEDYRLQFETNFFGVIGVTQAVLPFMRKQGSGRIINMSSISGQMGFPGLSPYVASKHALEGFSESLSLEVKPFGIDVILVEPGSYETNIWNAVDAIKIQSGSPFYSYMSSLLNVMETGKRNHEDPLEVAERISQIAAQTKIPRFRYPIGKGVKRNLALKKVFPWRLIEKLILKMILR